MATSNSSNSASSDAIKMPSEPCPVPSIGSDDEESFVVLGKSMTPDYEESPIGASIVREAQQLISKELSEIEGTITQKSEIAVESRTIESSGQESVFNSVCEVQNGSYDMVQSNLGSNSVEKKDSSKLDQSTLPVMPDVQKSFHNETISSVNSSVNVAALSADLSSQEVQNKIAQIIEENICLKETILQNNLSMKSQYDRIVAWQNDVQKVHESHKAKLLEAKDIIEKLKKENLNLKQEIEKAKELKNMQDEELLLLKAAVKENQKTETLEKSSDENLKQFELDVAIKKLKDLQLDVKELTVENNNLKENSGKLTEAEIKIEQLETLVQKLKEENEELIKENESLIKSKDLLQVEQNTSADAKTQIEILQQQVENLKKELNKSNIELIKTKSVETEKQKQILEEVTSLRNELYKIQQNPFVANQEEVKYLRHQLMNSQMALTQCEESRMAAHARIDILSRDVAKLEKELAETQVNTDELFVLRTQLDVYKADFEAERNAKETMKSEKERIAEDLQQLHRRNQQLQEEVELLRERDFVHVGRPSFNSRTGGRSSNSSSSSASSTARNIALKCPKCAFGFSTLQALENHVYRCIELDDNIP